MGAPIPTGGVVCVGRQTPVFIFGQRTAEDPPAFRGASGHEQTMSVNNLSTDMARYFANLSLSRTCASAICAGPFLQNFLNTMVCGTQLEYAAFALPGRIRQRFSVEGESTPVLLQDAIPPHAGWFRHYRLGFPQWPACFHRWTVRAIGRDFWQAARFSRFQVRHLPACNRPAKAPPGVLSLASSQTIDIDESMRSFVHQAVDHLALFLETLYLKNRLKKNLPRGRLATEGSRAYNPNFAPNPRKRDND